MQLSGPDDFTKFNNYETNCSISYKLSENTKEAKLPSLYFEAGITFISKRIRLTNVREEIWPKLVLFVLDFYIYVYKKVTKWIQQGIILTKFIIVKSSICKSKPSGILNPSLPITQFQKWPTHGWCYFIYIPTHFSLLTLFGSTESQHRICKYVSMCL